MAIPQDLIVISKDANFQSRVQYALFSAAIAVMTESGQTQGHAERVKFANVILAGNANYQDVAVGVLTNAAVAQEADITKPLNGGYAIPDGDIQFTVNSLFSAFAGVSN